MSLLGRPPWWQALHKTGLFVTFAVAFVVTGPARAQDEPSSDTVAFVQLPPEAQATYRSILAGGPFAHSKDGIVFGNRERALPARRRGFYHEYTVDTPGARNRGARRIVCGGYELASPQACFFTADHYTTFRQIVQ